MFDEYGEVVEYDAEKIERKPIKTNYDSRLNERGEFEVFRISDNKIIRRSKPFEKITLCGFSNNCEYFICNDKSEFVRLEMFDSATNKFVVVAEGNSDIRNVDFFDNKLTKVDFFDNTTLYFDSDLERAETEIKREFAPMSILWQSDSNNSSRRLVCLDYSDKPSDFIVCSISPFKIFKIIKGEKFSEPLERKKYFYKTRDGLNADAILTFPPQKFGRKNLPLIVFPHGGPASSNEEDFDARTFALANAGFLVAQPNYRGSANRGKTFRFAGVGLKEIELAQNDIEDCALTLAKSGLADKEKIGIMGGSWGGFCAQYGMVFKNKTYKAGVSIFGCSDIESMLKTFPKKSKYHLALDEIQYGTIEKDKEKMALISPLQNAKKIEGKLLMFHFYDDEVIDFSQTKDMFEKLVETKKDVEFVFGKGDHSFGDHSKEFYAYKKIISFFKEHLNNK